MKKGISGNMKVIRNGIETPVKKLLVGDKILGFDVSSDGIKEKEIKITKIVKKNFPYYLVYEAKEKELIISPFQMLYTDKGWKNKIEKGKNVYFEKEAEVLEKSFIIKRETILYNIEGEGQGIFVNGFAVGIFDQE